MRRTEDLPRRRKTDLTLQRALGLFWPDVIFLILLRPSGLFYPIVLLNYCLNPPTNLGSFMAQSYIIVPIALRNSVMRNSNICLIEFIRRRYTKCPKVPRLFFKSLFPENGGAFAKEFHFKFLIYFLERNRLLAYCRAAPTCPSTSARAPIFVHRETRNLSRNYLAWRCNTATVLLLKANTTPVMTGYINWTWLIETNIREIVSGILFFNAHRLTRIGSHC